MTAYRDAAVSPIPTFATRKGLALKNTRCSMIANDGTRISHENTQAIPVGAGARRSTARGPRGGLWLFTVLCVLLMAGRMSAQTARVAGEVTNFGSTLTNAAAVALDSSRNAYVLTTGSGSAVYKETFNSTTGVYTETQLFTVTVGTDPGIAVDSTGANIFVATGGNKTVVQYTGAGTSYTPGNTAFTGFTGMTSVAVDATENVYVADAGSGNLYKETYSGSAYSQAQIGTGLGSIANLAIDASGNLFASTTANLFYKLTGSGTTYTKTALAVPGFTALTVTGLAVDANDDLFVSTSGADVWESLPSGTATYTTSPYYQYTASAVVLDSLGDVYLVSAAQPVGTLLTVGSGYLNFGSVGPGTPPTMTIAFTLTSATGTTLGTPTVVTQGLTGYDFAVGTGGTCAGLAVTQGNSCTVVVQFAPQASGSRLGAVNLIAGSKTLASSFLGGVGFAPLAAYQSVTLLNTIACPSTCGSSLPNGLSNGRGITVDPAGNVWVANSTAAQILKFPAGSQTPIKFATSSTCQPVGTAIDGEGNVFYTCNDETNMYELVGGAGTPVSIPVGVSTDDHLSVDAAGNLYPTSYQPSNYFLKIAAGTHAVSVIATAPSNARFVGAVTDAAGNTFAPDYNNDILYELPAGSNTLITLFSGAPLQAPHAIAEDAAGSLYVTTTVPGTSGNGTSPLLRFAAGNYTATPASLSVPGGDSLYITPDGDFYTVYTNSTLAVYTRSIFSLTYADTAVGQTSASQTVTLENDGTAPLTIAPPSSGTNPSVSLNFSYVSNSTCPELSNASASFTLGAGSSCTQIVEFTPQQEGSVSGSLVTTDNSANVAGSAQTIKMTGTATQGTPTVSVPNVTGTLGQSVTLTATVSGGGTAPTGAISFVVGSGPTVTSTTSQCSTATGSETCTVTYPTSSGLVAGSDTITATVAADTNYLTASGTGTLTLAPAVTASAVTSSLNPSTYGTSVTFTAKVTSGYGTPTGSVTFLDGSTALATVSLSSGQATYSTSTLLGGSHAITVSYGGSTTFATSTSTPVLTQVVNTVTPTVSVTNVSGTLGQNATVTATVTGIGVAPAGAVSFIVGSGAPVAATCTAGTNSETCTASYPTNTGVVVGANTITASVVADTNYKAASGTGTLTLAPAVTTSAVTSSLNASTYDSSVTFTAAVSSSYGTPTGSVTFYDGMTALKTVALSNGSATYTTSTLLGGNHSITVQYGGVTNFAKSTSTPVLTQVVNPIAPTVSVANGTGVLGQNATLTATVTGGGVAPAGAVSFTVGSGASVPAICTAGTSSETCTASYPTNTGVSAGANTITASYTADGNYTAATGTGTLTMAGATTTSSVMSSANPSTYGSPVTFTATVASGYGTPTGSVQFLDGMTVLATVPLSSGQASYTTSSLLAGSHPITVAFVGSTSFAASTSSPALSQVVNKVAPTVSVANVSGTLGQSASLSATVTGVGVAPTGAVSFVVGSGASVAATCTAGTNSETCTASYPTGTGVAAGANAITASYTADANYTAASGTGTLTMAPATTASSVVSSLNPSTYGTSVTFNATVTSGYGTPTGSVSFSDDGTVLATVPLSGGKASYATSALFVGNHPITVTFGGSTSFATSTSSPALSQVVNKIAPTVSVTNASGTLGQSATLTATVTGVGVAPTGAVSFIVGSGASVPATCTAGTNSETCTATYPTNTGVIAGANTITASYTTDANYTAATGTGTLTLAGAATTSSVVSSSNPSTYGSPVTFTATVASGYGTPTGSVTFYDGTTPLKTVALSGGSASYTTSTLLGGNHSITVQYGGVTSFAASTSSPALAQVVNAVAPTVSVANVSGSLGQNAVLTATVTGVGIAPAGAVSFVVGSGATVPATCTAGSNSETCTASYPTGTGVVGGANTITASVAADTNYQAASGTGTLTMGPASTTSTVASSQNPSTYGTSVTFTATVASGYGTPTGSVTFSDGGTALTTVPLSGGKATYATSTLLVGSHPITVTFGGVASFAASTSSPALAQVVNKVAPAVSVASASGTLGQNATLTATVTGVGVAPTGALSFTVGSGASVPATCTAGTNAETCTATYSTNTGVVAGANTVTASYATDANYTAASGTGTLTLAGATTTSSVTSSANPSIYGSPVTFTAAVASGYGTPTGSVTFYDGTTALKTVALSGGSASYTTSTLLGGNHSITVQYGGSTSFAASTSSPALAQVVNPVAPTVSVPGASGTLGQNATLTATVTGGNVAPTGAVTFVVGNGASVPATCTAGTNSETCTASYPTNTGLAAGANTITASVAADTNYQAASGTGTLTMASATTTSSVVSSLNPSTYASPVTFNATVSSGYGTPDGSVQFLDGTTVLATVPLSGGKASYTTSTLLGGTHSITVAYGGVASFTASTSSPALAQVVGLAATTNSDTATGSGTFGAPSTPVSVRIPYAGQVAPTGTITLTDTHNNNVTVPLSNCTAAAGVLSCTATLPTANEPAGSNSVTVSQAADSNYAGSTGGGYVTLSKAAGGNGDTASGTGTYGAATTAVTVMIPFTGATPPAGAITVTDTHSNTVSIAASACIAGSNALTCTVNLPTATEPVGGNAVTVSQAADANYTGSTGGGTVTIGKAPATTNDTAYGTGIYAAATTPVVITIPYVGTVAPSGAVTVADGYNNTVTATVCLAANGVLTCTANLPTPNEPTGGNPVTVTQAADTNYSGSSGSGTVTINPAGARGDDTVTGSGSYGSPATPITVLIPYSGSAPTGLISVADRLGNAITIAASSCQATGGALVCSTSLGTANEPVGANPATVAQAADANHSASTGSGAITINKAAVTTADAATGSGTFGTATTAVTVMIPYAAATAPSGVVSVTDALGNTVSAPASACTAATMTLTCVVSLPTANEPIGSNAVTVAQAADTNYSGSTGAGTVTIAMSTVSPVGSTSGGVQNVTINQGTASTLLTATLTFGGATPPTGAVVFTIAGGASVTASCTVGYTQEICTAAYPTASLQVGAYTITASEAADANYAAGSATGILTVASGSVSPILDNVSDVSNVLITTGTASATLSASITFNGPVPSGGLTFNLPGGTPVAATCTAGPSPLTCTAAYPTASLVVGTYVITATEAADSTYPQGLATALLTVQANASNPTSPILTTGSNVSSVLVAYGTASATLTANILYNGPVPTGAVTFTVNDGSGVTAPASCVQGTSSLTCTATWSTGSLGIGGYRIEVDEAADANYPAGRAIGTLTVTQVGAGTGDAVSGTGTYGSATTPITVTIPYVGSTAPTGDVTVTDSFSNTVTLPASGCTASSGLLTCTGTLPTANVPVGSDAATVGQAADSVYAASTGSGAISMNKAAATTGDTATGTGTYGAATTPVTVTISYAGVVVPTGAVTVTDTLGNTVTVQGSNCSAASGTLTCNGSLPTANEPLGSNSVTVSQAGDANYTGSTGTGTVTIGKAGATNNDTASGTGIYGAAITAVTINIPYIGGTAPTGAVTLTDGYHNSVTVQATSCTAGSGVLSCSANLPTASEPVGANPVTVSQAGDANYAGSTGTGTVTINKVAATSNDTVTGTSNYGSATTTVTVTIPYTGTTAPTGAITVTDSHGNTVTVPPANCTAAAGVLTCTASLPTANVPAGSDTLTVSQAGDSNYSGSTGSGAVTIAKAPATTTDTATGTSTYGAASTAVTITIPYAGTVAPTGAVSVTDGFGNTATVPGTSCTAANGTLTCLANLSTANEPQGNNPVAVTQIGDANYAGSTGTGTVTINKAVAGTDSASGTGTYGAATTPISVTIPYSGATAPTGVITVADTHGNTVIVSSCTVASNVSAGGTLNCSANMATANEPVGANAVTVSQTADASHSASSGTGTVTINKAPLTSTDTVTGTGTYGAATTQVTVTIPYAGTAAPTGAVTITDGQGNTVAVPGSSCTAAAGVLTCMASLPTANVAVGTDTLTVTQAGDSNYAGSTGTGSLTIGKASGGADNATGTGTYGAATTPVTVTIPYTGTTAPTGAITLADTHGNTVTVSGCTAAASVLTCSANLPTANEPIGANAVTVSQAADTSHGASTGAGTVTITKAPLTSTDTATGTGIYGAATSQVTVTIPYAGTAAPTGAVTIADGQGNTITVPASSCAAVAGVLTCTANLPTANVAVGSDTLTVTQAGDSNYTGSTGTGAVTIAKAAGGNDTVSGTGTYGAATTAVTVSIPYTGATPPTGAITIADTHGDTIAVPASSCTASKGVLACTANLPTANDPAGSNTVTVTQAADANSNGSSGTGTVTIGKAAATTGDTATGSGKYGAATTPVTVSIPYAGTAAPTGAITVADTLGNTVTVAASSCTAAAGALSCTANLPTANVPVGTDSLTEAQAADANYSGSTGAGSVTIAKTTPTLTAPTVSPMNAAFGTSVTITQTVPSGETGTVTFSNGTTVLGTGTISNGVATLTTTALPQGTDSITATANGDANYSAATSPAVSDNVGGVTVAVALTSPQSTTTVGSAVMFSAAVTATPSSTIAGTVTFYDGTAVIGMAPVSNGVATMSTSTLSVGNHTITASFAPAASSTLNSATSAAINEVVQVAASTIALTSSQNPAIVQQAVTFTATVPAGSGGIAPTGMVTFYDGTTVLGTVPLNASGVANYTTSALTGGAHNVTASYAGDSNYAPVTSAPVAQKISDFGVGNTTPALSADPGGAAAFNITINPSNGITFAAPVVLTVTGLPANATSSFSAGTVTPGTAGATSTMTVQSAAQALTAMEHHQHMKDLEAAAAWACLFPLLGLRRVRRRLPKALLMLALFVGSFGVIAPLTGCGGGYFGPQPATYTLTVTGTSGTLQRSTTVTLHIN